MAGGEVYEVRVKEITDITHFWAQIGTGEVEA